MARKEPSPFIARKEPSPFAARKEPSPTTTARKETPPFAAKKEPSPLISPVKNISPVKIIEATLTNEFMPVLQQHQQQPRSPPVSFETLYGKPEPDDKVL